MNQFKTLMAGKRSRPVTITTISVLLLLLTLKVLLPGSGHGTHGVPNAIIVQSLMYGFATALGAAALVLVFQTNGIINFAQIAIGSVSAEFVIQVTAFTRFPFVVTLIVGLLIGVLTGGVCELIFVRRFTKSPRLILTIVTVIFSTTITKTIVPLVTKLAFLPPAVTRRPLTDTDVQFIHNRLPFSGFSFSIGGRGTTFGFPELFAVESGVVGLLLLAGFLKFTRSGVAVRAASQNAERATLLGISVGLLSTATWMMAGLLSSLSAITTTFTVSPGAPFSGGFTVLLLPLAGAVIAKFKSIPTAVASTLGLSVLTGCVSYSVTDPTTLNLAIDFFAIGIGLVLSRKDSYRLSNGGGDFQATSEPRPIPQELAKLGIVRGFRFGSLGIVLVLLILLPFLINVSHTSLAESIAINGIVALSLVVLTGWMGQVSLGQYAFVAVGAVVTGDLAEHAHFPFLIAVPFGVVASAALAVAVGIPALRVRGLGLAAFSFALAALSVNFLFDRDIFGHVVPDSVRRPSFFFLHFNDSEREMYYLCLAAFLGTAFLVLYLRRTRIGRLLIASRDNETTLQSLAVPLVRTKILGFVIAGSIAGLAGSLSIYQTRGADATAFPVTTGVLLFCYVVLGGVSSVNGAVIATLYLGITSFFFTNDPVVQQVIGFIPLIVVFLAPGGVVSLTDQVRDAALRVVAQRRQIVVKSLLGSYDAELAAAKLIPMSAPSLSSGLAVLGGGQTFIRESILHGEASRRAELKSLSSKRESAALSAASSAAADTDLSFAELIPVAPTPDVPVDEVLAEHHDAGGNARLVGASTNGHADDAMDRTTELVAVGGTDTEAS